MLLNRYPLRLNSVPDTMAGVIREMEALLPDVKRIIEKYETHYIHDGHRAGHFGFCEWDRLAASAAT